MNRLRSKLQLSDELGWAQFNNVAQQVPKLLAHSNKINAVFEPYHDKILELLAQEQHDRIATNNIMLESKCCFLDSCK